MAVNTKSYELMLVEDAIQLASMLEFKAIETNEVID